MNQEEVIKEIHDFHRALELWGRGEVEESTYSVIEERQAIDLTIINGDGEVVDMHKLNVNLRAKYNTEKNLKIWAEIMRTKRLASDHFLAVYSEHNKIGEHERQRLTTAIFRLKENLPNRCEWIHLHETWVNS